MNKKTNVNLKTIVVINNLCFILCAILNLYDTNFGQFLYIAMNIINMLIGGIYAKRIGRNGFGWGAICFVPVIFPLLLVILKPASIDSEKYTKKIIYGLIEIILSIACLGMYIDDEEPIFLILAILGIPGVLFFISGIIHEFGLKTSYDSELSKIVDDNLNNTELTNANDYPTLLNVKKLFERGEDTEVFEIIFDELITVHKKNNDIYKELTRQYLKILFDLYNREEISYRFEQSTYDSLVENFKNNTDKLLTFIEKYGYDYVMINSPNFGVNMSDDIVIELQKIHKSNDEINRKILDLIRRLPKIM